MFNALFLHGGITLSKVVMKDQDVFVSSVLGKADDMYKQQCLEDLLTGAS